MNRASMLLICACIMNYTSYCQAAKVEHLSKNLTSTVDSMKHEGWKSGSISYPLEQQFHDAYQMKNCRNTSGLPKYLIVTGFAKDKCHESAISKADMNGIKHLKLAIDFIRIQSISPDAHLLHQVKMLSKDDIPIHGPRISLNIHNDGIIRSFIDIYRFTDDGYEVYKVIGYECEKARMLVFCIFSTLLDY